MQLPSQHCSQPQESEDKVLLVLMSLHARRLLLSSRAWQVQRWACSTPDVTRRSGPLTGQHSDSALL